MRDDESWSQEREEIRQEHKEMRVRLELHEARMKKNEDLLATIATKLGVVREENSPGEGSENGEELESHKQHRNHDQWRKPEIPIFSGEDAFGWVQKLERHFALREVTAERTEDAS